MAGCIKSVNRSASTAFSPDGAYIAAGTMAGAVDLQFSSTANLDIFELDFLSDDRQLIMAGTIPSSERFNRISWQKASANSEEYPLGLIAGGLVDGNIGLWNPKPLICKEGSDTSENTLVTNLTRHKGPVRGLEFNSITPHLIASGADEGDISIWDLTKPLEPNHFPALKGSGSASQGEISFLSWNSMVEKILASTSYNGTTVVWDLRKQKPVINFSDSVRRRCSVLQWNPDIATQLIVASDEDNSPSLKMWDVRNIMSPVKEFVGHTKGVIAMSWCPIDSSYLLTCSKDNRTICWDTISGEIVAELPTGTNWNFDVHWYPKIPGVISASSFDGKVSLYNIEGAGRYGLGEADFGAAPLRAPKWYKRKAGVSFGFGGKLVSFNSAESSTGSSEIFVHNLVTEHGLISRSSEFETAIQNGDRSALKLLCERKSQESESEEERETWGFMKVMFNEDGTARSNLLSHLGFSPPIEESNSEVNDVTEQVDALSLDESKAIKTGVSGYKESALFATDNGEDFFNNLPSPKADTPVAISKDEVVGDSVKESHQEIDGREDSSDPSFDDAVQRALVVGDYKGAVAQCISANRLADALVIAHVGGVSLWESTRDQYFRTSLSPYLKVVSAMVNNDLMSIANTRPLKSWKETLALFCTFSQADEWTLLCDTLAARLMSSGDTTAATLCYICAGNIDKTVEIWSKSLSAEHDGKSYVDRLQDLMEKTIVFALATGQKRFSDSLCKLVEKYSEILASQGLLTTAMEYLNLLGTEELSTEITILRDRIARSTEQEKETVNTTTYDNSQMQVGAAYDNSYSGVSTSQHHYQDTGAAHIQPIIPGNQYGDNYQQSPAVSYRRAYNAPPVYQPVPQSNTPPTMFVPSPETPAPVGNFPPPLVNAQPPAKFIPANPPLLRNAEQYQQPSTLGSHLYPGAANPGYQAGALGMSAYGANTSQVGPTTGQVMSQVMTPTPASTGFMPMGNSGVQRPGMNPVQPSSPSPPVAMQLPVTPAAPPPTVQTADTSNVPAQQKPVIATLTRLFNETSEALGGSRANPAKKREIEDNSKKLGALFAKLNSGDISKNAAEKLVQLCQALDNGDFATALQIQVHLTTSDWDECNFWLATLKRMIKTRQNFR
ncbi:protein transport protein SEC31 homolog B isoform X3 [Salvia hispanica]|uniref:protein transport protein SEC31 homolog B isoform X1 n=1 Tax=Salvia hispanica TaxID=49212 RepID=UPI0020096967|nr:protein transport protein SEC31 homolog B isoform X1 [Salvia hispanica]XP_047947797.1 protein transport protein SEC31 homolog B isoform X2 [Salvia hispanica]XP_047947798.1 protein transport protein SEC31 homolog B isoform X3 [Salvia hispanica]